MVDASFWFTTFSECSQKTLEKLSAKLAKQRRQAGNAQQACIKK